MLNRFLKSILPHSLMGRAVLILVVPVLSVLAVFSVVVVQRHYDRVTSQLTQEFSSVIENIRAEVMARPERAEAEARLGELAERFSLEAQLVEGETRLGIEQPPLWELSHRLAIRELTGALEGIRYLYLGSRGLALGLEAAPHGTLELNFPLTRVAPSNPHQLLVLTILAAALMTLIAFVFLRNQMRPIRRLASAADAYGRGEIAPLGVSGSTEVRAATRAFLQMRERIEAEKEQRILMLSGVSHDLRTPLTRMKLELSMIDDMPEAQGLLKDVAELEMLTGSFLDYVRGAGEEAVQPVDLVEIVTRRVAEAARNGDVRLLPAGPKTLTLPLRGALFGRALDNLLENARRYASRAEVWIERSAGEVAVVVEDDGPGITPEQRAEVMKPFVRLDPARSAGGGVGLGLAIVADALKLEGGRVELLEGSRQGLGGLRVRLVLPLPQSARSIQTGV